MINFLMLKAVDIEKTSNVFRAVGIDFVEEQHGSGPVHLAMVGVEVPSLSVVERLCRSLDVSIKHGVETVGTFRRMILETPEGAELFVQETGGENSQK